ncbi:MAG: DUF1016 family protein [Firmicutes bacterium]|nr:DUF1016 family protein [Bacillota bacterium]
MKTFDQLLQNVEEVHERTGITAKSAVNQMLTARNWAIGYYIVEFEQKGQDRAEYGSNLLMKLAERLNIKGLDRTMLNLCRIFYLKYPQMCDSVNHRLLKVIAETPVRQLDSDESMVLEKKFGICDSVNRKFQIDPEVLITRLSFTHLRYIMTLDDPFERFFYELECIKGTWSVRELRRQIDTKLFIRAGISKKPELLLEKIENGGYEAALPIKNVYALEFLGLDGKDEMTESDFEQAIMDHLQEFLLEMGKGFCFEARQKRIIIDDEYFFIDLVLYNRVLHCNVIVELKVDKFRHEHLSQLNMYVSYYKFEEMTEGDNPPIGILLCTEQGPKMVQYVLNGMDENLFASKYMLQLPNKEQLEGFLVNEMREMGL